MEGPCGYFLRVHRILHLLGGPGISHLTYFGVQNLHKIPHTLNEQA
jgi:hypothetical protein